MTSPRFSHLPNFMRAYLNEDWDLEYGTFEQAIEAFKGDASPEERDLVVAELRRALATTHPEGFAPLLDELGTDINPEPWGGPQSLLQAVLQALARDGQQHSPLVPVTRSTSGPWWLERPEALNRMTSALDTAGAVGLIGERGVGKSSLAREYADQHAARYPGGVHFVLGRLGEEASTDDLIARATLRSLVVLDDADRLDPRALSRVLDRRPRHVHVIITANTRRLPTDVASHLQEVLVGSFDRDQLLAVLSKELPSDLVPDVVDRTQGRPLLVAIAVDAFRRGRDPIDSLSFWNPRVWPGAHAPPGTTRWTSREDRWSPPSLARALRKRLLTPPETAVLASQQAAVEWAGDWLLGQGVEVRTLGIPTESVARLYLARHDREGSFLFSIDMRPWRRHAVDLELVREVHAAPEPGGQVNIDVAMLQPINDETYQAGPVLHEIIEPDNYARLVEDLEPLAA
jgi:hypothetical protein